jgi:hypothetical protein
MEGTRVRGNIKMKCPNCGKEIKLTLPILIDFETDPKGSPMNLGDHHINVLAQWQWDVEGASEWYCPVCFASGKVKPIDGDWNLGAYLLDRYGRDLI